MLPTSDGVCSAAYPEKETAESASIAQLRLARAVLPDTSLLSRSAIQRGAAMGPNLHSSSNKGINPGDPLPYEATDFRLDSRLVGL